MLKGILICTLAKTACMHQNTHLILCRSYRNRLMSEKCGRKIVMCRAVTSKPASHASVPDNYLGQRLCNLLHCRIWRAAECVGVQRPHQGSLPGQTAERCPRGALHYMVKYGTRTPVISDRFFWVSMMLPETCTMRV